MKQLIYIGGGDCYRNDDEFAHALEEWTFDPSKEEKKWKYRLADKLKETHTSFIPAMPNIYNARYRFWKIWFEKIIPYLNDTELICIGHSLGAMFLVKYLSENTFAHKIHQLHLVSGCFDDAYMKEGEGYLADFTLDLSKLSHVSDQTDTIFLYHSTDDDTVPYTEVQKYQKYLPEAKLTTFTDRGHFRQAEFPELLENILTN